MLRTSWPVRSYLFFACVVNIVAAKRRIPLAARYNNDARHMITSRVRKYVAADSENPIPVPITAYVATHAGHLGNSARIAPGTIHPAFSRRRRTSAGRCGSLTRIRFLVVS